MISRRRAAQILLYLSAVLILVGGLYDLLTPSPPPHHLAFLGVSAQELDGFDHYRCGIGPRAHKHLSNYVPDFSDEPVGRSAEVKWKTSGGK